MAPLFCCPYRIAVGWPQTTFPSWQVCKSVKHASGARKHSFRFKSGCNATSGEGNGTFGESPESTGEGNEMSGESPESTGEGNGMSGESPDQSGRATERLESPPNQPGRATKCQWSPPDQPGGGMDHPFPGISRPVRGMRESVPGNNGRVALLHRCPRRTAVGSEQTTASNNPSRQS